MATKQQAEAIVARVMSLPQPLLSTQEEAEAQRLAAELTDSLVALLTPVPSGSQQGQPFFMIGQSELDEAHLSNFLSKSEEVLGVLMPSGRLHTVGVRVAHLLLATLLGKGIQTATIGTVLLELVNAFGDDENPNGSLEPGGKSVDEGIAALLNMNAKERGFAGMSFVVEKLDKIKTLGQAINEGKRWGLEMHENLKPVQDISSEKFASKNGVITKAMLVEQLLDVLDTCEHELVPLVKEMDPSISVEIATTFFRNARDAFNEGVNK